MRIATFSPALSTSAARCGAASSGTSYRPLAGASKEKTAPWARGGSS
jgi:hypothetical protein